MQPIMPYGLMMTTDSNQGSAVDLGANARRLLLLWRPLHAPSPLLHASSCTAPSIRPGPSASTSQPSSFTPWPTLFLVALSNLDPAAALLHLLPFNCRSARRVQPQQNDSDRNPSPATFEIRRFICPCRLHQRRSLVLHHLSRCAEALSRC